jgi:hypothetical protein
MAVCLTFLTAPFAVLAQDYDVSINNGRVLDPETGFDAIAHVGL